MPVDPATKERDVARKMQFYGELHTSCIWWYRYFWPCCSLFYQLAPPCYLISDQQASLKDSEMENYLQTSKLMKLYNISLNILHSMNRNYPLKEENWFKNLERLSLMLMSLSRLRIRMSECIKNLHSANAADCWRLLSPSFFPSSDSSKTSFGVSLFRFLYLACHHSFGHHADVNSVGLCSPIFLNTPLWFSDTTKFDAQSHVENIKGASAPTSKDQARSEGEEAVEHLRVLAKLVFTNSEVRKLLSDITVLGRDVAAGELASSSSSHFYQYSMFTLTLMLFRCRPEGCQQG